MTHLWLAKELNVWYDAVNTIFKALFQRTIIKKKRFGPYSAYIDVVKKEQEKDNDMKKCNMWYSTVQSTAPITLPSSSCYNSKQSKWVWLSDITENIMQFLWFFFRVRIWIFNADGNIELNWVHDEFLESGSNIVTPREISIL